MKGDIYIKNINCYSYCEICATKYGLALVGLYGSGSKGEVVARLRCFVFI